MILTEEKITVTYDMVEKAGMTRGAQFGIPDGNGGLVWKDWLEIEHSDLDKIENYFLNKQKS